MLISRRHLDKLSSLFFRSSGQGFYYKTGYHGTARYVHTRKRIRLSKILVPALWEERFDHDSVSYAASGH